MVVYLAQSNSSAHKSFFFLDS